MIRGLHGGPETQGPGTRTGSGLYFKWSAGSRSGPNLLLRVPDIFNIVFNTRVDRRTLHLPEISAKKNTRYLSRQKQSVGRLNVVLQADGDHGLLHE